VDEAINLRVAGLNPTALKLRRCRANISVILSQEDAFRDHKYRILHVVVKVVTCSEKKELLIQRLLFFYTQVHTYWTGE